MAEPRLVQVTGMTGSGKSFLVSRKLIEPRPRVIIAKPFAKTDYPGALPFRDVPEMARALHKVKPKKFRVAVCVDTPEAFDLLCKVAWALAPVTLVLDETALYIPNPNEVPYSFKAICQMGRHAGKDERQPVSVILIGQRPVNAPPIFRAEVEHWYVFRLNSRQDRQLLEYDFGLPREKVEEVGQLDRYEYMLVDRYGEATRGKTTL